MTFRPAFSVAALVVVFAGCSSSDPEPPALPKAPVEIVVDDRGIAHVYAEDDEDLFYGYGYQLASDRLLQLDMFRRFAHGRLSEVLGAGGPGSAGADSFADDRFARIFDWKRWGRADAALMREQEPEQWTWTSAWVAGINARVDEVLRGEAALPFGFAELDYLPERWDADDPYVVQKMAGFGLDQSIQFEVFYSFAQQFAPETLEAIELLAPAHPVFVLPEDERPGASARLDGGRCREGAHASLQDQERIERSLHALGRLGHIKPLGSNNWAVDGRFTDTGRPLLAGDPHLGYAFSGVTYGVHLSSKHARGSFDASGFSFVGAPGIFAGHNDRVAWTPTSAFADVMDMWAVTIADGKVDIGGTLVDATMREETIAIRDADPETITIMDVPGYGVIMPSSLVGSPLPIAGDGKEVLVGWTGFSARPARYFRELMRAQSIDELDAAVLRIPEMTYNFFGADAGGISYRVGVAVPERNPLAPGRQPFAPMDGGDPEAWWPGGTLDAELLPHSRAEERGWIASANNDPFGFTADGHVDNDPFYYGAFFPPGWRAKRIEDELARLTGAAARGGPKVTAADMQALQMDVHSGMADDLAPVISAAWQAAQTDPLLAEFKDRADIAALVALLTIDWDRRMARQESGALAFHAFAHLVTARILEDELSPLLFEVVLSAAPMYLLKVAKLSLAGEYENGDAILQGGRDRIVLESLADTAAFLEERFGGVEPERYRFEDMRVSTLDHAYGRGVALMTVASDGGEDTVNVAQSKFRAGGEILPQWESHWGPIERQVFGFDADGVPETWANFALGNVADEESAHFDDALADWLDGGYHKLAFGRAEVDAAAEARIVLAPR